MKIYSVLDNSPAFYAGIKQGEDLLSINGHEIADVLDYRFYSANKKLKIMLSGKTVKLKKEEDEELGLVFETALMDDKKQCRNNCIFCFIDQNPPNMRETIYFKDDDARLSFLQGNYITLTNLSDNDVKRIIDMKISVNVSVHTTNPELRCKIMNNRRAGEKLQYFWDIANANIPINCQIVLCKNWNDGRELFNTLRDLKVMPSIQSIAVVPVGLTKYREGLEILEAFNKEDAMAVVEMTEKFDGVYASDEFYLRAEKSIPPDNYYLDYAQYENGVGMIRYHITDFEDKFNSVENFSEKSFSVATGVLAYDTISDLCLKLQKKTKTIITVYKIKNNFFGESITVAGLLTGIDVINQLSGKDLGEKLLLTSTMFNADGLTLDGMTVSDIENALNIKIHTGEFLM